MSTVAAIFNNDLINDDDDDVKYNDDDSTDKFVHNDVCCLE